jgi:hypothetical protein
MNKLPLARHRDVVVQELGEEILVYDLNIHKAFNLNETSSKVYNACDGKTTFEELKRRHEFTDDLIYLTLDQLKDENLIEDYQAKFAGVSRREVIRKVGLATMIALPVIIGLTAPTAIQAASCAGTNPAGTTACGTTGASDCAAVAPTCQSCAATFSIDPVCITPGNPNGGRCTCT